jgi:hypothetical protein
MIRKLFLAMIVVVLAASVAPAQDKTNFSGNWKLNVAKSEFGPVPPPTSQTQLIEQKDNDFTCTFDSDSDNGKEHAVLTFTADGKQVVVPADSPNAHQGQFNLQKIQADWVGPSLVVTETGVYSGMDVLSKRTYSLSPDGKVLTITVHLTLSMGDLDLKWIYDKQ